MKNHHALLITGSILLFHEDFFWRIVGAVLFGWGFGWLMGTIFLNENHD